MMCGKSSFQIATDKGEITVIDIWKKKIVLYGNEKIKKDFKYLFKELDANQKNISNDADSLIIICEQKKKDLYEENMKKKGLKYKENYMYIEDFFLYYNPLFLQRDGRKVAVWGTGVAAEELWRILKSRNCDSEIDFFVDNAQDRKTFKGKKVVSSKEIKDRKDIYIIVASFDYQWEIYGQLQRYGFEENRDYIHCNVISTEYRELLEKVCFTESKYSYVCDRPFGYCDVIGDNLYLCCPDFLPISAGSMKSETFMKCWNSYIARIIRLSVCNGTFALCNKRYCDYFEFEDEVKVSENDIRPKTDYEKPCLEYPAILMVGIDYSCNLQCPSCRANVSIAAPDERKEIDRWAEDLLENVIPYVGRLWMAGSGEIFCSPTYKMMMKDKRCTGRESISILSNGTLFNESNWKLLEGIYSSIEVVISVDGIKDHTIEKLRKGSNAKKLKDNLEFLGALHKNGKIDKFFVNCVLQAENVEEIYEMLEYCKGIGVDKVQFLKLNDHGTYKNDGFDSRSLFDKNDRLKREYKHYFTENILMHPLADWFNIAKALGVKRKPKLDKYDTM